MKHKKREPRCTKCGSSLVWPGKKVCQRCRNIQWGRRIEDIKKEVEKGKAT